MTKTSLMYIVNDSTSALMGMQVSSKDMPEVEAIRVCDINSSDSQSQGGVICYIPKLSKMLKYAFLITLDKYWHFHPHPK